MSRNEVDHILFGAAYYDEYLMMKGIDRIDEDMKMMKAAGLNVIRIAESTWSTCEPQPGVFDFTYVDRALDAANRAGIDVIVGFPGETEAEVEDTLRALSDIRFDMIYSFIYSPRKGTPAAEMEQVPEEVQKNRFARMLELQNGVSMEKNQPLVGKTLRVLCDGVSKSNADLWTGRTAGNKSVFFPGSPDTTPVGQFIPVRIERAAPFALYGKAENPTDIL